MRSLWEIREDMKRVAILGDPESAHGQADDLLIEALRKMTSLVGGDPSLWPREVEDLIQTYEQMEKWYA